MNVALRTKMQRHRIIPGIFFIFFLTMLSPNVILAQQSSLVANTRVDWIAPAFTGFTITKSATSGDSGQTATITNENNIVDADAGNFASMTLYAQIVGGTLGCITPVSTPGQGIITITNGSTYNSGNYVSFVITNDANTTYMVQTSSNGTTFTNVTAQDIINMGSGNIEVGGFAAANYTHIRLVTTLTAVNCSETINRTYQIRKVTQVTYASAPNATCNQTTSVVRPLFNVSVVPAAATEVVDASTTNFTSVSSLLGMPGTVNVTDNFATYPTGSFMGFRVANSAGLLGILGLDLLNSITLRTYLNGTLQETKSGANVSLGVGLLTGSTPYEIGFITTLPANQVEISFSSALGSINVYNAIFKCFSEGPALACNTRTILRNPAYPVTVDKNTSGLLNVGLLGENIVNLDYMLDVDTTNYVTVNQSLANVGNGLQISVKKSLAPFPGGYYAGFDIGQTGTLSLDLTDNLGVATYLDGSLQETVSGNGSLLNLGTSLLNGDGRKVIGFRTDPAKPFNEIRLISTGSVALNVLKQLRIYGVVVQQFCAGTALACNTPVSMTQPAYPVYIDGKFTSNSGLIAVAGAINTSENVIDADPATFASIDMTAGVGTTTTFAVTDAITNYTGTNYVSFDIASNKLADAGVLSAIRIRLIRDGVLLNTVYTPSLLAGIGAAAGEQRQQVGIITTEEFDGAQLVIDGVANIGLLGTLKIYGVSFENLCAAPLSCNQTVELKNGQNPVVINDIRTGAQGLANVTVAGSAVEDPWYVIDTSSTNYAKLTKTVGVANSVALSVINPVEEYPIGAFAGFRVLNENTGLLQLDLFNSVTVTTYLDGVVQDAVSGNNLINLGLVGFPVLGGGGSGTPYDIGFYTTRPFDEIQISLNNLVGVNAGLTNTLRVYSVFVDTRFAIGSGLLCSSLNPDFGVNYVNRLTTGNLSTNDRIPSGTIYGSAVANASNPDGSLPAVSSDGTYLFTPALPGVYKFDVSVCLPGQTAGCTTERLTISVIDPVLSTNRPIVNEDVAVMKGAAGNPPEITIGVLQNDGAGNLGGSLGMPVAITSGVGAPAHGTTSVNGAGQLVYTPAAGFYGTDEFAYTICEMPSGICDTGRVRVTVLESDVPNSTFAADDYTPVVHNTALTVVAANGVLANDTDPEGNTLAATPKTETAAGKGTFILNADGSYTFTPVPGYLGNAQFTYEITDNGTPVSSANGTIYFLVRENPFITLPDLAVAYLNREVAGSVAYNDKMPLGAIYGTPVAVPGNPNAGTPVITAAGDYIFTPTAAGRYEFDIPVCMPDQAPDCPVERLVITVLNPAVNTNVLIANNDVAYMKGSNINPGSVTINVKSNDDAGNIGGTLSSPVIPSSGTGAPANGTVSVDANGNVIYTPAIGFFGTDQFTYSICETPSGLCQTATVSVEVMAPEIVNSTWVIDDYVTTTKNKELSVNAANGVLANDNDPENNVLAVVPKTETIAGKGTLVLAADGSYVFTPVSGFIGPVTFSYDIVDNGTPVATAKGTLMILVRLIPDLTITTQISTSNFTIANQTTANLRIRISELEGSPTMNFSAPVYVRLSKSSATFTYSFDPALTTINVPGAAPVDNTQWELVTNNATMMLFRLKPEFEISSYALSSIGVSIQVISSATTGTDNITTVIYNGSGGEAVTNNNSNVRKVNIQ
ncbi:MAG: tandem-95 repeat protein [Sphingobacteriales bacterium]|nr:MAG: tandem-95 repeat protein [Sphingobacteriales bacterium]